MNLLQFAKNLHSQWGEDGILQEVFRRVGPIHRTCCEFGAWDGIHLSNCRHLILQGWRAVLIEGDSARFKNLAATYRDNPQVVCVNRMVDAAQNSVDRICAESGIGELDFLSIDIDGLDCEMLESLRMRPRVICIEVSGGFSPQFRKRIPAQVAKDNIGQSLGVMTEVARALGYGLACYTANAIFVQEKDLRLGGLPSLSPQEAYEHWHATLDPEHREWLYLANLGLVDPNYKFGNPYLKRRALGISLRRAIRLRMQRYKAILPSRIRKRIKKARAGKASQAEQHTEQPPSPGPSCQGITPLERGSALSRKLVHAEQDRATLFQAMRHFDVFIDPMSVKVALDVGSRDGFIAGELASFYPRSRVYAFECNPAAVSLCRQIVQDTPCVSLVEKAVTDTDGLIPFYPINPEKTVTPHPDGNIGASSLFCPNPAYPYETYVQDAISVPATRLDTWASAAGVDTIDVLWMDLQGAELKALVGLGELLRRVRIIYTEVSYRPVYEGAPLFDEVRGHLEQNGFHLMAQLNTGDWFGDAVFVRQDLRPRKTAVTSLPVKPATKEFVIQVRYGGLGDHLFMSHLPRIAKLYGGYNRVYISKQSVYRHEEYRRLIWDTNPFVDGYCDDGVPETLFDCTEPGMNLLDRMMIERGLDDGLRFHEPELYFVPEALPELAGKTVYDPNYVSYVGDFQPVQVERYFHEKGIVVDCQMRQRDKSIPISLVKETLEATTLQHFCRIVASCAQLYCLTSGTATLAAALGKPATAFYGRGQKAMFHHSRLHTYVLPGG